MNRRFEDILEESISAVVDGGQSVEECLARYPQQAADLEPLIRIAVAVREASRLEAAAPFKEWLQQRLLAQVVPQKMPRRPFLWGLPRWATATAAVLLAVLVAGGTVVTSASSLPGDALYPVKTATEGLRLTLAQDPDAVADLHLEFAQRRLAETKALAEAQRTIPPSVLDDLMRETQRAEESAYGPSRGQSSPDDRANARLAVNLARVTARQQEVLAQVVERVPPQARPSLERVIGFSQSGHGRALALLGLGAMVEEGGPPSLPSPSPTDEAAIQLGGRGQGQAPSPPTFPSPPMILMMPRQPVAERPAVANELAAQFGVNVAQVRQWQASGLGYGDIFRILQWSQISGRSAEEIAAMRLRGVGVGWGRIQQELELNSGPLPLGDEEGDRRDPISPTPESRREREPQAPDNRTPAGFGPPTPTQEREKDSPLGMPWGGPRQPSR